jgi:hypothetical protein
LLWGPASTNHSPAAFQIKGNFFGSIQGPQSYSPGLAEVFTPISSGKINLNTASPSVLQMIPMIDPNIAAEIIRMRSGPDGADGTEDDTPLRNPGELVNVGLPRQLVQELFRYCDVRSRAFEVQVDAEVSGYKRHFVAVVGRNSPRDLPVLSFTSN